MQKFSACFEHHQCQSKCCKYKIDATDANANVLILLMLIPTMPMSMLPMPPIPIFCHHQWQYQGNQCCQYYCFQGCQCYQWQCFQCLMLPKSMLSVPIFRQCQCVIPYYFLEYYSIVYYLTS